MPSAEDFDKLANLGDTEGAAAHEEDEEGEAGGFGPKRPDQMSAQEVSKKTERTGGRRAAQGLESLSSTHLLSTVLVFSFPSVDRLRAATCES
jgi:hypothetical protein